MALDDSEIRLGDFADGQAIDLDSPPGGPRQVHVISEREILAVLTAKAAGRALLVRGEPGTGKTQLAKAAAAALRRPFVPFTVDSRTEARDLLWKFDAVGRLAEAQVRGAGAAPLEGDQADPLATARFVQPGPLWWAFAWDQAYAQAARSKAPRHVAAQGADPSNGVVVLIDEIDKAESEVPNGLLEALGAGAFTPQGFDAPVQSTGGPAPLVFITTNEERGLPDAFLRRCLVLHLGLPDTRAGLIEHLVRSGKAHFGEANEDLLARAAALLADDRAAAEANNWRPPPGQAEYLDLVRAVIDLSHGDAAKQAEWLDKIKGYALHKHPSAVRLNPGAP
jgi:MoxR-like ATPase